MSEVSVKRTPAQNIINGWKKSWSVRLSSRAEGALVERFEKHVSDHLAAMEAKDREIEGWKTLFGTAILYLKTTQGHEIAAEGFLKEYKKLEGRNV